MENTGIVQPSAILAPAIRPQMPRYASAADALAGMNSATRDAYMADWKRYASWCEATGRRSLPVTPEQLTGYERHLACEWIPAGPHRPGAAPRVGMAPASIQRSRGALSTISDRMGYGKISAGQAADQLRAYQDALARTRDPRARQRQASSASRDDLAVIAAAGAPTPLAALRDKAMILLGYSARCRASELVFLNIENLTFTPQGLVVEVWRPKTHKFTDATIRATDAPETILAVQEWLAALAASGRTQGPLFVHIGRSGRILARRKRDGSPFGDPEGRLDYRAVSKIVRRHAQAAGIPGQWSGHSLGRSFATNSHDAGHDQLAIARHGGWVDNSQVLARYIQEADPWSDRNALRGAGI